MKVLVTGAAGFIGANLCARLARSGFEVAGIDNFSSYYSSELKEYRVQEMLAPLKIPLERFNLCDLQPTNALIKTFNPHTVIHLAAQPGVRTPLSRSGDYIQNNLVAFSNILQATVQEEIPNFLYASSSSVYGDSEALSYKEGDHSIKPISIYGATKLANEILAPAYISGSKTRARGMRFFTVYGPWGRPDMAYFRLVDSALNGSKFKKFGAGEIKRDFTYIDDITAMIQSLAIQLNSLPNSYSDVVNIGGGNPHSLNDLIQMISSQIKSSVVISQEERNPNDTKYTSADVSNLIALTGKKPEIDLRVGVTKTIQWANQPRIRKQLTSWAQSTN